MNDIWIRRHALMANRKKGRLPYGYTEIEYIENQTNAWIYRQPIYENIKVEMSIQFTKVTARQLMGENANKGYIELRNGIYMIGDGGWQIKTEYSKNKYDKVVFERDNEFVYMYVNDIEIAKFNNTVTKKSRFHLFNIYGQQNYACFCKMKYCKIWNNGNLTQDFVPCVNPYREVGLYDLVEGKFYGSSNEYKFNAGPEIDMSKQYIQNGLVFWLDGRRQGGQPNKWIDLIHNIPFDLVDCVSNEDNVQFDGVKSYGENKDILSFPQNKSTIECCIYDDNNDWGIVFLSTKKNICLSLFREQYLYTTDINRVGYERLKGNGNITISVNMIEGLKNKIKLKDTIGVYQPNNNSNVLGKATTGQFFKGKIYAIRIYNRHLTEEEILHNQQLDINNYFGGVIG